MSANHHILKTDHYLMPDIRSRAKQFDVRKDDRGFAVGDTLLLQGWNKNLQKNTEHKIKALITYILPGGQYGIQKGYVVLGIKVINCNF
ncbi:MAG: DUF3850 domain-containing protein [Chitinophagales bacterium]